MKAKLIFFFLAILHIWNVTAQTKLTVRLDNPVNIQRNEMVPISWDGIKKLYPQVDSSNFIVVDSKNQTQVVYQLETQGKQSIQNLLLYVNIPASGYQEFIIKAGKPQNFPSQTFCRYVPERKDDFAWENDRIAYRMYGRALENTRENGYGIDVWAKKVDYPIIDKWYKANDYHTEHGEGHDFYKVGLTLGAGDIAPYEENKIWYPANYHRWKILDNGPLRSCFRLEYDIWDVAGKQVSVTKTISIDAGSQLNKIEVHYIWNDEKPLTLVVGLAKRSNAGTILLNESKGIAAYWEPVYQQSGVIGTACLLNQATGSIIIDEQILNKIELKKPGTLTYYNAAVWDKAGKITSAEAWFEYLNQNMLFINSPVNISLKASK